MPVFFRPLSDGVCHCLFIQVMNTEYFEMVMARVLGMTSCSQPITRLPVTAARHVANGTVCFREEETYLSGVSAGGGSANADAHGRGRGTTGVPSASLADCVPPEHVEYVRARLCSAMSKRS